MFGRFGIYLYLCTNKHEIKYEEATINTVGRYGNGGHECRESI